MRAVEETAPFTYIGEAAGAVVTASSDTISTASRTVASGNQARCALVMTFTNGATINVTYRIKGLQFEKAAARSAFQASMSTLELTETGFSSFGYIRPDRSDDVLSTVLTQGHTGDVAILGRTASKLESGITYADGATLSLGASTVTGMTAGVLASVGDVIGLVAIGKTLTAADKALLLAWGQARGAGGWI